MTAVTAVTEPSGGEPVPDTCQVLVSVGTDHHRFDRLVDWIDSWTAANPGVDVVVQRGTARAPSTAWSIDLMPYDRMIDLMRAADAVVVQGGPAGILDARGQGRLPIVVPRRGDLGEHVDGHQVTFSRWMAERGQVALAETEPQLHALLDAALADPSTARIDDQRDNSATLSAFAAAVDGLFEVRRP